MKSVLCLIVLAGLTLPMTVACQHTVAQDDQTTHHWNGTTTHNDTTVKQNDLTGSTTVTKEKNQD